MENKITFKNNLNFLIKPCFIFFVKEIISLLFLTECSDFKTFLQDLRSIHPKVFVRTTFFLLDIYLFERGKYLYEQLLAKVHLHIISIRLNTEVFQN